MSIQILPEQVVAQIAAGEVVERPASVVKELIENALDAGASTIAVTVNAGGRKLIRVSDDGSGISSAETELAFARHATSKLRSVHDLELIQTLGFRGEALSSIASVSHVNFVTRHHDETVGTHLRLEGGILRHNQPVGVPSGTTISVENLFFNTPARLKFLKKENTEKRYIASIITRYAMAYPQVRFILEQDGREVFRSNGRGELADAVLKALGLENFKQMIEVEADDPARDGRPAVRVYGYTSAPELNRADRGQITLFVNGRWVQDSSLAYAVIQAYHTLLMNGRYPLAVLMIEIAPHEVDVNVHPTKAEVRFRDAHAVFSTVQRAVREAVVRTADAPQMRLGRRGGYSFQEGDTYAGPGRNSTWLSALSGRSTDLEPTLPIELGDPGQFPGQRHPTIEIDDPTVVPYGPDAPERPRTLPVLRVVGQVGAMYIVAEGPSGMYLVDQHAAHERILYEQYLDAFERQDKIAQHVLMGQTIDLAPDEARLIEEKLDILATVGFTLESFGPNTFMIRTVPAVLSDVDPAEAVVAILDDLIADNQPGQLSIENKIIAQVCRRAAVKAGQILSIEQMQNLIRQLERARNPHTCPHGRPTMLHMSGEQLAREFGRA